MEAKDLRNVLGVAGFGALTAGAAAVGAYFKPDHWYGQLKKPWFQPPKWVFAPVWTGLYALIAASGYRVWKAPSSPARTRALTLWGVQLGFNAAWSYLFFGRHDPRSALVDLGLLQASVAEYARAAAVVDPAAPLMMAPYRGWLGFASLLNASIVRKNPSP